MPVLENLRDQFQFLHTARESNSFQHQAMAGTKRNSTTNGNNVSKKSRIEGTSKRKSPKGKLVEETATDSDPIVESDTASQSGEDDGTSWPSEVEEKGREFDGIEEDNEEGGISIAAHAAQTEPKPSASNGASAGIQPPQYSVRSS